MAKKETAKKAPERREFVCADGSSQKFWTIHLQGSSHTVTHGRIGLMVRTQSRNFASEEAARKSFDKLIAEKVKIGYVDDESGAAAEFLQSHQAAQERERLYYGWSTQADFSRSLAHIFYDGERISIHLNHIIQKVDGIAYGLFQPVLVQSVFGNHFGQIDGSQGTRFIR